DLAGLRVSRSHVEIDRLVERSLAECLRSDAAAAGGAGECLRLLGELGARYHAVHETPGERGPAVDRLASEEHLERALATDGPGDGHHRRGTEPATLAAGRGEGHLLGGHGEVAGGDELTAGGGRDPLHGGDDGLPDALEGEHEGRAGPEEAPHAVEVAFDHVGEI